MVSYREEDVGLELQEASFYAEKDIHARVLHC